MGSTGRSSLDREQTREKILAAARELIVREGYEAVSMRKIAARVEFTAMALYRHFADKETLLRALCLEDFRTLRHAMDRISVDPDPIARLRRMGLAYVDFALEFPNQYRLLFMTPSCPARRTSRRWSPSTPRSTATPGFATPSPRPSPPVDSGTGSTTPTGSRKPTGPSSTGSSLCISS